MAIVKMNKITMIGLEKDKERIMESLMKMGVVEIVNLDDRVLAEELLGIVGKDGDADAVQKFENDILQVGSVIDCLNKFGVRKKKLFEPKRQVDYIQYSQVIKNEEAVWNTVNLIRKNEELLSVSKSEENRLNNLIATLEPWKSLNIPVDVSSTRNTVIYMGVVPAEADFENLSQSLNEAAPASYIELAGSGKEQSYLLVVVHKSEEDKALEALKRHGFARVTFKEIKGTVQQAIADSNRRIGEIREERSEIEREIASMVSEKGSLEILYDHLVIILNRKKAVSNLVKTSKAFMLEGWVPSKLAEKVRNGIFEHFECVIDIAEPGKDEEYPILLDNPGLVRPFEMITELYSLPSSKGIDPNLFMAPFYFIFFGMMISDAGYGLLMAVATGLILWKLKPKGMAQKLIKMVFLGGISTFIWGALFGGWFGNIVEVVSSGKAKIPPLWFNPLDDPMRLLIWSFIFGAIHIFVGMGLKAYMLIREGKLLDAVFDIGSWYILLIGAALLIVGGSLGNAGKYMALTGALMLLLTQGRAEKNVVKRLLKGLLSLYGITGYLGDILSYSRLLALGLATGVIANVINTMGALFGFSPVGIVCLVIVFAVGTVFNIAINTLGAYVHSSRLQYVEFFGKFFEGGGKGFKPFKINTKYINLIDRRQN